MVYASSREALRRSFQGIHQEVQGTDYSEVAYEVGAYPSSPFGSSPLLSNMPLGIFFAEYWVYTLLSI